MTPLKVFRCPSDAGNPTNSNWGGYVTSNYVINREVHGPGADNKPAALSIQAIPDGSSNTILVGERDYVNNVGAAQLVFSGGPGSSRSFEGRPGTGINIKNPSNPPSTYTGTCESEGFNSLHTGGVIFLLGDGSVHLISNSIGSAANVSGCGFPASSQNYPLQNLIHPADGNPIGGDVF
jgi:hypothetical protein